MDSDDGQKIGLNYELLVEDSLRMVVRAALTLSSGLACRVTRISISASAPSIRVLKWKTHCDTTTRTQSPS